MRAAGVVSPHFSLFSKRCPANKLPDAELSLEVAEGMVGVFLPLPQAPGSLLQSSPNPLPPGALHSLLHILARALTCARMCLHVCACVHMCLHVCVCVQSMLFSSW